MTPARIAELRARLDEIARGDLNEIFAAAREALDAVDALTKQSGWRTISGHVIERHWGEPRYSIRIEVDAAELEALHLNDPVCLKVPRV